jgi:hypothetical protein
MSRTGGIVIEEVQKSQTDQDSKSASDSDDRVYEAPEVSTLGTVGELTSVNEGSLEN